MPTTNPRVDAYIEKAQPFARPILKRLRKVIHRACPQCTEVIKWSMPAFDYKGPFCTIAGFKQHCVLAFWKAELLDDPKGVLEKEHRTAMGHLGRITSMDALPSDAVLTSLIRQAMKLNDAGAKVPQARKKKPPLRVPMFITDAIKRHRAALATWERFPPSHKREYVEWITEAKTDATRERRLKQMLEWLAEGKSRNWKYERKA